MLLSSLVLLLVCYATLPLGVQLLFVLPVLLLQLVPVLRSILLLLLTRVQYSTIMQSPVWHIYDELPDFNDLPDNSLFW